MNWTNADWVVVIHFAFILFVIFGGLLALKYRGCVWLHLPALIWGILIELTGWICPLTIYENQFRESNGGSYANGFIEHYLIPLIYPSALTREIQIVLGMLLLLLNIWVYAKIFSQLKDTRRS